MSKQEKVTSIQISRSKSVSLEMFISENVRCKTINHHYWWFCVHVNDIIFHNKQTNKQFCSQNWWLYDKYDERFNCKGKQVESDNHITKELWDGNI